MQINSFIPETAPFKAEQRLWLNGYMAGLLAAKGYVHAGQNGAANGTVPLTVPLLILFGSQTGTAEKIAKQIAKESKSHGCNPRVMDAAEHAKIDWSKETNLLIVTSTYGDGDMPDNAQAFWDWLQTDAGKTLAHLNFSVLALGDTNYEQFCAAGKKFDARLEQLGAKRIHALADCDLDYEAKTKTWTDGVLKAVSGSNSSQPNNGTKLLSPLPGGEGQGEGKALSNFSRNHPFPARLLTNKKLNAEGSLKETRHFEISLDGSGLNYEAGDALGIWPSNCPDFVADILNALGCDGEEAVKISGGEFSLRKALREKLDISKPAPELLEHFAKNNPALRALLAPGRKEDFTKWLWGRGVIDLLLENSAVKFSAPEFAALLKPLAPRLYSISSSPKAHAGQVHLTINVVRYEAHGRARKGLASTFLADRVGAQTSVPVFIQAAHGFRLPADGETPVIMIGPGTGVAPFRAFLHERRAAAAPGKNWLFFGEQRAATDFYYRDELEKMFSDGHLAKLSTAFSRDQAEKIYVQNRMLENAAELWSWLEAGAHFYVCGDATRMAKDVDEALHKIIETAGGKSADDAKAYVAKLKTERRYQRDVY
jgi:sulfite reductase (NADPH) flavoprotein alpha-component